MQPSQIEQVALRTGSAGDHIVQVIVRTIRRKRPERAVFPRTLEDGLAARVVELDAVTSVEHGEATTEMGGCGLRKRHPHRDPGLWRESFSPAVPALSREPGCTNERAWEQREERKIGSGEVSRGGLRGLCMSVNQLKFD